MEDIGIGIIGLGFMGKTQAETISKYCLGAKLRAVTDVNPTLTDEIARKYGVAAESSVETLLMREDVSAVFIETPHYLHGEQALAAIDAGKHVMIDKPMAHTVELCDEIIEASREVGVLCSVVFSQRCRNCNMKAKELISGGEVGRIRLIQEFSLMAGGLVKFPKWQSNKENLGILFGHGVHSLDRIRWLTEAEIATVHAKCTTLAADVPVEGTSMVMITMTDGTIVSLLCSGELLPPSFPRKDFNAMIVGEKGLMDLDAYGELMLNTSGKWEVVERQEPIDWAGKGFLDPARLESYTRHAQGFIDAIKENRQPPVTGWDGRQAVAAALAALESSKTGKEVVLSK